MKFGQSALIFSFAAVTSLGLSADQLTVEGDLIVEGSVSTPEIILDGEELLNPKELNQHRGANLFTNGFGTMGSAYNMSSAQFDPHDKAVGEGAFVIAGYQKTAKMREYIPAEAGALYSISFYARSAPYYPGNRARFMVECFDVDKRLIQKEQFGFHLGSTTTLAAPLEDGDTEIFLTDVSGFVEERPDYDRALIFWNYTNSLGYTYPPETYSQNIAQIDPNGLWAREGGIDYINNKITLLVPWSENKYGAYPAGTPVSQIKDGSTHLYPMSEMSGDEVLPEWTYYSCTFRATRPGTAYFRVSWRVNEVTHNNVTKLSGITLEKVPMIPEALGDISMGDFK